MIKCKNSHPAPGISTPIFSTTMALIRDKLSFVLPCRILANPIREAVTLFSAVAATSNSTRLRILDWGRHQAESKACLAAGYVSDYSTPIQHRLARLVILMHSNTIPSNGQNQVPASLRAKRNPTFIRIHRVI
jgi:hypothetical protein